MNELKELKNEFLKTGYINLFHEDEDTIGKVFEFYKDLNVVKDCDYIWEGYHYDDYIECEPKLYKAENVEDAWKIIEDMVNTWLEENNE